MALNLHHHHQALPPMRSLKRPASGTDDINNSLRLRSRKCLFGATDPADTLQMVKENLSAERTRFYERFGVHIEDLDRIAIDEEEYARLKSLGYFKQQQQRSENQVNETKSRPRKVVRIKRVLRPHNEQQQQQQMKMTDYCPVKKSPTMDNVLSKSPPLARQ